MRRGGTPAGTLMPAGSRIKALEQAFQKSFRKRPPQGLPFRLFFLAFPFLLSSKAAGLCEALHSPAAFYFLLAAFR